MSRIRKQKKSRNFDWIEGVAEFALELLTLPFRAIFRIFD
jgi:hypothetical protein